MAGITDTITEHRAMLGNKPQSCRTQRIAEAQRITHLLCSINEGFSFGRIGDYDVALLLHPHEAAAVLNDAHDIISGTRAAGSPGLVASQTARLKTALARVSYLDYHERLWKDTSLLDQLKLERSPSLYRNSSWETSYILPTWMEYEFKQYCSGRKLLFCGAEAPLLARLFQDGEYRKYASAYWPDDCDAVFMRPEQDGNNLGVNLDRIKDELRTIIERNNIDTLFLSLGGGAKILCYELANELQIRAIDFGACMRSLTYSGSDGNLSARSTHTVFLFRVPFTQYMDSLELSFPNLSRECILAKAHAQLLLEVQKKEIGWTYGSGEYDFGVENIKAFNAAYREYVKRYHTLFSITSTTIKERKDFLHFCGKHRLTSEGYCFILWFMVKGWIRSLYKLFKRPDIFSRNGTNQNR